MKKLGEDTAFLMIDIQNDFCPGGALAVNGGDEIIGIVNAMQPAFGVKILTQDWHPANHASFACNHDEGEPFSLVDMPYGPQVLWPSHCVQGSSGSQFHRDLNVDSADLIIRKGFRRHVDSYSAFFENDKLTPTGLQGYLNERGVKNLVLAGLATDFCVYFSAIDAVTAGFNVQLVVDACRAIDLDGSLSAAMDDMTSKGIIMTSSAAFA